MHEHPPSDILKPEESNSNPPPTNHLIEKNKESKEKVHADEVTEIKEETKIINNEQLLKETGKEEVKKEHITEKVKEETENEKQEIEENIDKNQKAEITEDRQLFKIKSKSEYKSKDNLNHNDEFKGVNIATENIHQQESKLSSEAKMLEAESEKSDSKIVIENKNKQLEEEKSQHENKSTVKQSNKEQHSETKSKVNEPIENNDKSIHESIEQVSNHEKSK